ncbi:MAG TPA: DUF1343 domain-containing protein, partial [Longimicrobiales bacterium]
AARGRPTLAAMLFGADRLAHDPGLLEDSLGHAPHRLALLTNDAVRLALDPEGRTRAALLEAGLPIVRLFSPEHGLGAAAPDGAAVGDAADPLTGLPVSSLYGESLRPSSQALEGLDGVLCDLPDIGVRCYTYVWTLTHMLDACAQAQVPVVVLDRPNPLSGALETVEGPMLEAEFSSFIGRHTVPLRHGLTLAEMALLWRRERQPGADVRVIACSGWRRRQLWPELGLPFVPTSPALRRFEAALLYAGTCLFEATNLSVGRGSAVSFEGVGAPWLRADKVLERVRRDRLVGLELEQVCFTPELGPHAGQSCPGVKLVVADAAAARPVSAAIALLAAIAAEHTSEFRWALYPTAANPSGEGHIERISGSAALRRAVESDPTALDAATVACLTATPGWEARHASVALYA